MKTRVAVIAAALVVSIAASKASADMFSTGREWLKRYNESSHGAVVATYYLAGAYDVATWYATCPDTGISYRTLASHVADYLTDHPEADLGSALGHVLGSYGCVPRKQTPAASKERF
jgi:hypothetical protein